MKLKINLIALQDVNGYKKGETFSIYNNIFDIKSGIAFNELNKKFSVLNYGRFLLKDINDDNIYEYDKIRFNFKEENGNLKELTGFLTLDTNELCYKVNIYDDEEYVMLYYDYNFMTDFELIK